jgi:hypothetical protein
VRTHLGTLNLYMMFCKNLIAASYVMFTTGMAYIHLVKVSLATNRNLNPLGALGKDIHDVDSPDCKGVGEINRTKRVCMLCRLLLEELGSPCIW